MLRNLYAHYWIFLRCAGGYSDADLLQRFGLGTYQRAEARPRFGRYAILADDGEWTVIADDLAYTLWHMHSTRPAIAELGKCCDVYSCSIADCDDSFDFDYFRGGHLIRRYVVAALDDGEKVVIENIGEPLAGESTAFKQTTVLRIVLAIANSLGIKTNYPEHDVRVYVPRHEP